MLPTTLSSDIWTWQKLGIGEFHRLFEYTLTPEVREWLKENVGEVLTDWWWDHFTDEGEVSIMFPNPDHAMMFKLVWL